MGWTEADGDALFRQPPEDRPGDDAAAKFDGSREAMRRLRNPFEAPSEGTESPEPADER